MPLFISLVEVAPNGDRLEYSDAVKFYSDGSAPAPDGGADFRKMVYRAERDSRPGFIPVAPGECLVRVLDGDPSRPADAKILLEERTTFPAIPNPSANSAVNGFMVPVDLAAARGTPFEAAVGGFLQLPRTQKVELGATAGTRCTAKLTFKRAAEPEFIHCARGTGAVHCYRLHRASVWLR